MVKKPAKAPRDILRLQRGEDNEERQFLSGQLLIAMPGMEDERFSGAVVYICAHSEEGAMGLVINQPMEDVDFHELVAQLDLGGSHDLIAYPGRDKDVQVLDGGPMESGRGFVLHSPDFYSEDSTLEIDEHFSLTTTLDVLRALAEGSGPDRALLTLGYASWGPGQLDSEMQGNGWLHCAADPNLVFNADLNSKYAGALRKLGIRPGMLSAQIGHS